MHSLLPIIAVGAVVLFSLWLYRQHKRAYPPVLGPTQVSVLTVPVSCTSEVVGNIQRATSEGVGACEGESVSVFLLPQHPFHIMIEVRTLRWPPSWSRVSWLHTHPDCFLQDPNPLPPLPQPASEVAAVAGGQRKGALRLRVEGSATR